MSSLLGQKTSMTVAFAYFETVYDLGWTWRHNQGRIYMHTQLLEDNPALSLQTIYEETVPEFPECSPVFENWAVQGVDLIVGTSNGYELCMAPLAVKYPATVWLAVSGSMTPHPDVSNLGIAYARIYQPTFLAGIIAGHASETGKIGCVMPIKLPETQRQLAAFALGVAHVNASYEVHVGWTNGWNSPKQEILGTKALADLGADVVFFRTDGIEGLKEAGREGLYMVGFNADDRMLLGEAVLVSPYFNWGIIYLEVAKMVLLGTFDPSTLELFPGMREGAVALSDPSFLLKKSYLDDMNTASQAILNGSDPFCGEIRTNEGTTVGAPGHCSNATELTTMMWQPFNVVDHGTWLLPSQACLPGTYEIWDSTTWTWTCLPCPAGTHSTVQDLDVNETITCTPCAAGEAAKAASATCQACSPGTAPSAANDTCVECPADTFSSDGTSCIPCSGSLQSSPGSDRCNERQQSTANLAIVIAVLGTSIGISTALVGWVLFQRHAATAKVVRRAPRGDVAIAFVDIHSSTTLWDRYPEAMSWTLKQHNHVVRNLLTEFDGYEVKTVGDAFMVVFQNAIHALQCAMRIQEDLLIQHWPLELQQEESCSMQKDMHNTLIWNGPRVRTGIHFGSPDVVVNRQRGRVDYLGPHVDLAARVESRACGGQTLITEDMHRQIPADLLAQYAVRSVGSQHFKEETRAVDVFSVLPKSLATRVFMELKENRCLRCEGPTICPKCDAVLDHGLTPPASRARPSRLSLPRALQRSPMMFYNPPLTPSHEELL